jgi:hypothetical protein
VLKAEKGRRKKMSKAMTQATSGHNLRVMIALTLVAVLQTTSTTSDSAATSANPAMSAEGKGGSTSSVNDDPIKRHAEVVKRLGGGSLR